MPKGKRDEKPRKARNNANIGLFDIPNIGTMGGADSLNFGEDMDDVNDQDLEAELAALMGESGSGTASRPKIAKVAPNNLDAMIAASLKDIPSDEDSGDENDPDLLAELKVMTNEESRSVSPLPSSLGLTALPPKSPDILSLLNERIRNYKEAEANAKLCGDTAKSRRLARGLKTLQELTKKAEKGIVINEEDIPLQVAGGNKTSEDQNKNEQANEAPLDQVPLSEPPKITPSVDAVKENDPAFTRRPAPPPPVPPRTRISLPGLLNQSQKSSVLEPSPGPSISSEKNEKDNKTIELLIYRRDEYKKAALIAKKSGDMQQALSHIKVIKQFDAVITAVESGQPVDLSAMPPPPSEINKENLLSPQIKIVLKEDKLTEEQNSIKMKIEERVQEKSDISDEPLTILSALEQRMAKFKEQEEAAKSQGNSSKIRRMGRIVKQYEDAIKLHVAGKHVPINELPTPPGFPPIPVDNLEDNKPPPVKPESLPTPTSPIQPISPKQPLVEIETAQEAEEVVASEEHPADIILPQQIPASEIKGPAPPPRRSLTRQEKQLNVLLTRQKQFKEAALKAKKNDDLTLAKEYLRQAKMFDPLIEASQSGLPIDMDSIPISPNTKNSLQDEPGFSVVSLADCLPGSDSEIYERLLNDLQSQFKLCLETRNHYKSLGDIAGANKFEQLAVHTKKDFDLVKTSHRRGDKVPRFQYEKKIFTIVKCNIDLNDNDLELSILQGINYNVPNPKEIDTYVRYEFPSPNDENKRDKTAVIYNTNNPNYNAVFSIAIQRSLRAFQRIFKRHSIKFEVWSKGGFLRSDTMVGTVNLKLQPLETKCTIHDSFDLMDGRKAVGGKLEIKVRLRHPIQTKQVEQIEEKWIILS